MIDTIIASIIITGGCLINGQPPPVFAPPVDFYKEEITLTVDDGMAAVSGVYYFRNNTDKDKPFPVLFPFHIDSAAHFPHEIRAYLIENNDTLTINFQPLVERGMIRMAIPMKPKAVTAWHLDYAQRIDSPRARYILTSTSAWKKPLEEAVYRFVVPKAYDINFAWPEADSVVTGDKITLWSSKTDFMPRQDMMIIWERK